MDVVEKLFFPLSEGQLLRIDALSAGVFYVSTIEEYRDCVSRLSLLGAGHSVERVNTTEEGWN